MSSVCYFKDCCKQEILIKAGSDRIQNIIVSSKKRGDIIHHDLESKLFTNPNLLIDCHKSCVSTYTSDFHIQKAIKRCGDSIGTDNEPPIRRLRSQVSSFDFKKHCLVCGEVCLEKDPKNPSRWRPVSQCSSYKKIGQIEFKEMILDKCDKRGDDLSDNVRRRVLGVPSDLIAANAQYHRDCYRSFTAVKNVRAANKFTPPKTDKTDEVFHYIMSEIVDSPAKIWICTKANLILYYQSSFS